LLKGKGGWLWDSGLLWLLWGGLGVCLVGILNGHLGARGVLLGLLGLALFASPSSGACTVLGLLAARTSRGSAILFALDASRTGTSGNGIIALLALLIAVGLLDIAGSTLAGLASLVIYDCGNCSWGSCGPCLLGGCGLLGSVGYVLSVERDRDGVERKKIMRGCEKIVRSRKKYQEL
jgi:hypothetical protein